MTVLRSVLPILAALSPPLPILLGADSAVLATTDAPVHVCALPADSDMPVYKPPQETVPRARIESGLRGGGDNELTKDPALYWYVSQATSLPIQFTLMDSQSVGPIVDMTLSHPVQAGLQSVRLKDYGISLDPGIQYRWFVSVPLDHDRPSKDLVTGGMIERIEFNEGSALGFPLVCNKEAVSRYAEAGLWYDAIGCISELIESNPDNALLRKHRAFLLKQIDLPHVAEFDLRHNGRQ